MLPGAFTAVETCRVPTRVKDEGVLPMGKRIWLALTPISLLLWLHAQPLRAQSDPPKLEVGAQFVALRLGEFDGVDTGVGGRITYNFTRHLAADGEVNFFFPTDRFDTFLTFSSSAIRTASSSQRIEGLFGLKAGARSKWVGAFGKVRPGFLHFTRDEFNPLILAPVDLHFKTEAGFALDFGGVVELYPSRHSIVRLDLGDTVIRFSRLRQLNVIILNQQPVHFTNHNFQLSAGVGFRF
jgi:hypothetical protein